jgi:hypothetical protein
MHVIPALRRLRQEDYEFKASIDYIVTPASKYKTNKNWRKDKDAQNHFSILNWNP